jgi:hypothetical protein
MPCKKKSIHHQNIVVAAARDLVRRGAESWRVTHRTLEVLPPDILASTPGRRLDGGIKLIDLERRARFARLSSEFV